MDIAAFVPLSLCEHEGRVAAVVFTRGCNWRCPFCHNPELVLPSGKAEESALPVSEVVGRLRDRAQFLDSVAVTGGEPALQPDLAEFLSEIRGLGLLVKLDTNGSRPDVLTHLFEKGLVDRVAMDIKAPADRYSEYAGVAADVAAVRASIEAIRERAPDYEFRTTVAPGLLADDLLAIAKWIEGAKRFYLQLFRVPAEKGLVDPSWETRDALSPDALRGIWKEIAPHVLGGGVRG